MSNEEDTIKKLSDRIRQLEMSSESSSPSGIKTGPGLFFNDGNRKHFYVIESGLFVGKVVFAFPPGSPTLADQIANIGSGWHFCNGATVQLSGSTYTTPNARGKYFVGFDDSVTDDDYDNIGIGTNTNGWSGSKLHGPTENNHPNHVHGLTQQTSGYIEQGGGGNVYTIDDHSHGDAYSGMDDTDNRPPSMVLFALVWVGVPTVGGVVPA
jgi:hypothetical protein